MSLGRASLSYLLDRLPSFIPFGIDQVCGSEWSESVYFTVYGSHHTHVTSCLVSQALSESPRRSNHALQRTRAGRLGCSRTFVSHVSFHFRVAELGALGQRSRFPVVLARPAMVHNAFLDTSGVRPSVDFHEVVHAGCVAVVVSNIEFARHFMLAIYIGAPALRAFMFAGWRCPNHGAGGNAVGRLWFAHKGFWFAEVAVPPASAWLLGAGCPGVVGGTPCTRLHVTIPQWVAWLSLPQLYGP